MAQLITTVCAVIVCLFIFDWKFGIAALIPTILALSNMFKMIGPGLQESMKAYMDALEGMSNEAVEYIRGIPVVKTFQQTVFLLIVFINQLIIMKNLQLVIQIRCVSQ